MITTKNLNLDGIYKYDFETISNDLTEFEKKLVVLEQVRYIENPLNFYKESAFQKKIDGKESFYNKFIQINSRTHSPGSGYLTHGFDFYKGNFHGQMVRALINFANLKENSIIIDCFCGSGSTLIEANLLGFNSIGIDINPVACLNSLIKTKTLTYSINVLTLRNQKYLDVSYYKKSNIEIDSFKSLLDSKFKDIFYLFLYCKALSDHYYIKIPIEKAFHRNYRKVITTLKKLEALKKTINLNIGKSKIYFNDNTTIIKKIRNDTVDLYLFSPPYYDLIDYIEMDIIQLNHLFKTGQINILEQKSIGNREQYWGKMTNLFKEIYRTLKTNHKCIFVIGNQIGLKVNFLKISKKYGFIIEKVLTRKVRSYKNKKNFEHIIILKK